jgi:psiF repeat-containing protein
MRTVLVTMMAVSLVSGTLSMASAAEDKLTPQQEKMKSCNTQAADKKGDERKAFMSSCLKAGAPAAPMTQQDKMKVCNTKAGDRKGDERKTFMSECLKADKKS